MIEAPLSFSREENLFHGYISLSVLQGFASKKRLHSFLSLSLFSPPELLSVLLPVPPTIPRELFLNARSPSRSLASFSLDNEGEDSQSARGRWPNLTGKEEAEEPTVEKKVK